MVTNLRSSSEYSGSSSVIDIGSSKTVTASSKATWCLRTLLLAFASSHSKPVSIVSDDQSPALDVIWFSLEDLRISLFSCSLSRDVNDFLVTTACPNVAFGPRPFLRTLEAVRGIGSPASAASQLRPAVPCLG